MLEVVGLTMGVGLLRRHLVRRVYWPEERVGGECGTADVTTSGKLDFYFLVLIPLFLLATSKKSTLKKKY